MQLLRRYIEEDQRIYELQKKILHIKSWHGISAQINPVFWISDKSPIVDLANDSLRLGVSNSPRLRSGSSMAFTGYSASRSKQIRYVPDIVDNMPPTDAFPYSVLKSLPHNINDISIPARWKKLMYKWYWSLADDNALIFNETLLYDVSLLPGSIQANSEDADYILHIAKSLGLHLRVREVPMPQLYFSPGDNVDGNSKGTIGGFIKNTNNGKRYGVTCGHVSGPKDSAVFDASGVSLRVSNAIEPIESPMSVSCNSGTANKLDVGIVDIGTSQYSNQAAGITTVQHSSVALDYVGSSSNKKDLQFSQKASALSIVQKFHSGTKYYCFDDTIVFRPSLPKYINPQISRIFSSGPKPGDSGSWLLTSGQEWCGLIIGADQNWGEGYAIDADKIISWGNTLGEQWIVA